MAIIFTLFGFVISKNGDYFQHSKMDMLVVQEVASQAKCVIENKYNKKTISLRYLRTNLLVMKKIPEISKQNDILP